MKSVKCLLNAEIRKILLVRTDRMGDTFSATPAIRAVRKHFPGARIDILVSELGIAVARANPYLDGVFQMKRRNPLSWLALLFCLRRQGYDALICFNGGSSKAAFFARWVKAGVKCGISSKKYVPIFDYVFAGSSAKTYVKMQLDFLAAMGIASDGEHLDFVAPAETLAHAEKEYPRVPDMPRLAMCIGNARKIHSRWLPEKFALLAKRLLEAERDAGFPVPEIWIVYGKDEKRLLPHFTDPRLKFFSAPLADTAAFLRTCDAMITSSSGPWHLAAAVGIPTLSVISKHNHEFWKPAGAIHQAVLPETDTKDVRGVPVEPVQAMVEDFLRKLRERAGISAVDHAEEQA